MNNLPDTQFNTLIVRMINNFSENFNKEKGNKNGDRKHFKKKQSKMKTTIT